MTPSTPSPASPASTPGGLLARVLHSPAARWSADIALALGLLVALGVLATKWGYYTSPLSLVAGWLMVGSLVLRRAAPLTMLGVMSLCGVIVVATSRVPNPAVLVVPVAIYSVARWVPKRTSRIALVVGAIGSVLAGVRWVDVFYGGSHALTGAALLATLCFGLVVTPYAIGRRMLTSAELVQRDEAATLEREHHSMAEREQQLRIAEAAARAQIARELHDIVAHSLSVIIVQAEGGKALATKRPEAAAQVLGTIAESGREALGEMRRIVAVLRDGPAAEPEYAPTPGLDDIPELVSRSGAHVNLDVVGQVPRVPQTLGLTAYRIVQEALTNVLRHAGPDATAQVLLSYSPHLVVVEVVDNGRGSASTASSDGHGNGLRGMQERVASMGGQLVARPRSGGGFLVRALLPIVTAVASSTDAAPPARAPEPPGGPTPAAPPPAQRDADLTRTQYVPAPQMTRPLVPRSAPSPAWDAASTPAPSPDADATRVRRLNRTLPLDLSDPDQTPTGVLPWRTPDQGAPR